MDNCTLECAVRLPYVMPAARDLKALPQFAAQQNGLCQFAGYSRHLAPVRRDRFPDVDAQSF